MRLERTEDVDLIRYVFHDPEIWPYVIGDDAEDVVAIHPRVHYLAVYVDEPLSESGTYEAIAGLVVFTPVSAATSVPHLAILPQYRGIGTQALKVGIGWLWAHTPVRKLTAAPPSYNKAMIRVFEKCGFTKEGHSPKSFLRFGVMNDREYYGLEKD